MVTWADYENQLWRKTDEGCGYWLLCWPCHNDSYPDLKRSRNGTSGPPEGPCYSLLAPRMRMLPKKGSVVHKVSGDFWLTMPPPERYTQKEAEARGRLEARKVAQRIKKEEAMSRPESPRRKKSKPYRWNPKTAGFREKMLRDNIPVDKVEPVDWSPSDPVEAAKELKKAEENTPWEWRFLQNHQTQCDQCEYEFAGSPVSLTFYKVGTDFDAPTKEKPRNKCRGLISVLLCPCCAGGFDSHEFNIRGLGVPMPGLDASVWALNTEWTVDR